MSFDLGDFLSKPPPAWSDEEDEAEEPPAPPPPKRLCLPDGVMRGPREFLVERWPPCPTANRRPREPMREVESFYRLPYLPGGYPEDTPMDERPGVVAYVHPEFAATPLDDAECLLKLKSGEIEYPPFEEDHRLIVRVEGARDGKRWRTFMRAYTVEGSAGGEDDARILRYTFTSEYSYIRCLNEREHPDDPVSYSEEYVYENEGHFGPALSAEETLLYGPPRGSESVLDPVELWCPGRERVAGVRSAFGAALRSSRTGENAVDVASARLLSCLLDGARMPNGDDVLVALASETPIGAVLRTLQGFVNGARDRGDDEAQAEAREHSTRFTKPIYAQLVPLVLRMGYGVVVSYGCATALDMNTLKSIRVYAPGKTPSLLHATGEESWTCTQPRVLYPRSPTRARCLMCMQIVVWVLAWKRRARIRLEDPTLHPELVAQSQESCDCDMKIAPELLSLHKSNLQLANEASERYKKQLIASLHASKDEVAAGARWAGMRTMDSDGHPARIEGCTGDGTFVLQVPQDVYSSYGYDIVLMPSDQLHLSCVGKQVGIGRPEWHGAALEKGYANRFHGGIYYITDEDEDMI